MNDFRPFTVGTVFNKLRQPTVSASKPQYDHVSIEYPSRLEAMALDPSMITTNDNLNYSAGQIDFTVAFFKSVSIKALPHNEIKITGSSNRPLLIKHAALIMKMALNYEGGFEIDFEDKVQLKHCGLGSSSGASAAVAHAINELFGKPIESHYLVQYLAQNHGEEIEGSADQIYPVQCIGGSAACGAFAGGMYVLTGASTVIFTADIPEKYDVVIGIPKEYVSPDSKTLMEAEIDNFDKFTETGKKYAQEIAYRLLHKGMPASVYGDFEPVGDLIYDYRFNMGSIDNCSFTYPPIKEMSEKLREIKEKRLADILSMSSVGPGMFAITTHTDQCKDIFEKAGFTVYTTKIYNDSYKVTLLS